jgi:uncharacterized protein involved in exopolysaccharide biosynthesis
MPPKRAVPLSDFELKERNRLAATRCRDKKARTITNLETEVNAVAIIAAQTNLQYKADNDRLQRENNCLKSENERLESELARLKQVYIRFLFSSCGEKKSRSCV